MSVVSKRPEPRQFKQQPAKQATTLEGLHEIFKPTLKTDPEQKQENAKLVLLIVPAAPSAPDWGAKAGMQDKPVGVSAFLSILTFYLCQRE